MRKAFFVGGVVLCSSVAVMAGTPTATPATPAAPAKAATPAAPATAAAQKTCGQMTAETAVLPEKMVELMTAVAESMDAHIAFMTATNKTKESMAAVAAIKKIAAEHRELAKQFAKTTASMKAGDKWPAADHDMAKMMADPKVMESMKKQYMLEKEMAALIQKHVAMTEAMMPKGMN